MAFFVITGKEDCINCTHALHVADYLSKHLPRFVYRAIVKSEDDWPEYLDQINSMNNWHEIRSPVVWKEIGRMGGKAYLIGGLPEFWEYCYDYYGFESRMSKEDLAKIMADNKLIAAARQEIKVNSVSILGAANHMMLQLLMYELQNCFDVKDGQSIEIKLYDQRLDDDPEEEEFLLEMVDHFKDMIKGIPQSISVVPDQQDAIDNCDLLIVMDDYSRQPQEESDYWLDRCRQGMVFLADDINVYAKRSLRVVLNHPGPICFTASVLMEYCTTIRLGNIVAVTADHGISVISMMAERVGELVENFWCPPVWGFPGLMSFLTLASTSITTEVVRPYKRALKTKESTKLPKGEIQHEIRFLGSLMKIDDALYKEIEEKREREKKILHRVPVLPKIRAIGSLLRLWFADEISDDIIPLGVCSNGAFGFPVGICFSQPVSLNEKRIWEPVPGLPMSQDTSAKITSISLQVEATLKKFGLGERFQDSGARY